MRRIFALAIVALVALVAAGVGNAGREQQQLTCTSPPETATAGELGIPGVNPNDVIEFDFSAQVVLKP